MRSEVTEAGCGARNLQPDPPGRADSLPQTGEGRFAMVQSSAFHLQAR